MTDVKILDHPDNGGEECAKCTMVLHRVLCTVVKVIVRTHFVRLIQLVR